MYFESFMDRTRMSSTNHCTAFVKNRIQKQKLLLEINKMSQQIGRLVQVQSKAHIPVFFPDNWTFHRRSDKHNALRVKLLCGNPKYTQLTRKFLPAFHHRSRKRQKCIFAEASFAFFFFFLWQNSSPRCNKKMAPLKTYIRSLRCCQNCLFCLSDPMLAIKIANEILWQWNKML